MNNIENKNPVGLLRRLLAVFYDSILIIGLYMSFVILITYLKGTALESKAEVLFLQLSFIFIAVSFFCYFWSVNKGQTLGMQVWKIKLITENKNKLKLKSMILRCIFSTLFTILFFSNFIYIFFNKERNTLGDKLSKTKIIRIH